MNKVAKVTVEDGRQNARQILEHSDDFIIIGITKIPGYTNGQAQICIQTAANALHVLQHLQEVEKCILNRDTDDEIGKKANQN